MNAKEPTPEMPEDTEPAEWLDVLGSGGLLKKTIAEGRPNTRPERLEKCIINFTCTLEDETLVDSQENFELHLGECDVIQGLDVAISLMNIGEKCILKIEPRLAFGSKGQVPNIPPDALIIYIVELVMVQPQQELKVLSVEQRKIMGNKKRERGNWWYGRNENNLAIQCYRRAIEYLDEVEVGLQYTPDSEPQVSDADLQKLLEDRISVYNNMAAAQIKLELYEPALSSLQIVLRCQPNNVKALYRKAKVHSQKNDMQAAWKCLQKAKDLAPNDADVEKLMNYVKQKVKKQRSSDRELAKRMLNGAIGNAGDEGKVDGKKSRVGLWATVGMTLAVGVMGVVVYRFS